MAATASGGFAGSGGVSFAGAANISLGGTGTAQGALITFAGSFTLTGNNVSGNGNWSSNLGESGTWQGGKI